MKKPEKLRKLFFLLFILILFFFLDLSTGKAEITIKEIINLIFEKDKSTSQYLIFYELRLPRVLTAILAGISLPVSGLLLQTLFKNPLAGPYIFGISSGASLGVAILLMGLSIFGISQIPGALTIGLAGIIGASFILFIILLISLKIRDNLTILIIGVFIGSGISAIVNLMQYLSDAPILKKFVIWTMGSLDAVIKEQLLIFSLLIIIFFGISIMLSKYFDALYIGEENARTLGINIKTLRISILVISGIMTGITTAYCGPIGFVGIAIPHISRTLFNSSKHLELIIYSALTGIIIMLISDILSHSFKNQIIPINTITAILGIPVIIWVIFKNKKF